MNEERRVAGFILCVIRDFEIIHRLFVALKRYISALCIAFMQSIRSDNCQIFQLVCSRQIGAGIVGQRRACTGLSSGEPCAPSVATKPSNVVAFASYDNPGRYIHFRRRGMPSCFELNAVHSGSRQAFSIDVDHWSFCSRR